MNSQRAVVRGVQEPAILHRPPDVASLAGADECLELADRLNLNLDESQKFTLEAALGELEDGRWAAFEVADIEPRQNGKGDVLMVRELAGLFLFDEQLIIHTAHVFPTAKEHFLRCVAAIQSAPELEERVDRFRFGNGEVGIELHGGARLKFQARTGGAGRGFAGASLVVYDESMELDAQEIAATLPTLSTHPNPQVWYAGSAGFAHSTQQWSLRLRALRQDGSRLAYIEHTAERPELDERGRVISPPVDVFDEANVALANAAYNRELGGISTEFVDGERDAMTSLGDPKIFARERLGVWDELRLLSQERVVKLPAEPWAATASESPPPVELGDLALAFDVSRDGEWSSIAMAYGDPGRPFVEMIDHGRGVGWLGPRLAELATEYQPATVGCNGAGTTGGQLGPIMVEFREAGLSLDLLDQLSLVRYKQACAGFYSAVLEGELLRLAGQGPVDAAAADASERPLGDAWSWDVRNTNVPISPLVALTIARYLRVTSTPAVEPNVAGGTSDRERDLLAQLEKEEADALRHLVRP